MMTRDLVSYAAEFLGEVSETGSGWTEFTLRRYLKHHRHLSTVEVNEAFRIHNSRMRAKKEREREINRRDFGILKFPLGEESSHDINLQWKADKQRSPSQVNGLVSLSNSNSVIEVGTGDIKLEGKADEQRTQSKINGLKKHGVKISNESSLDVRTDQKKFKGQADVQTPQSFENPNSSTKVLDDSGKRQELVIEAKAIPTLSIDEIKQPEPDQLSMLFHELRIQKYLHKFKKEEYQVDDLVELSSDSLEEMIPTKAPRKRLKRWIVGQRSKMSDCRQPVLNSPRWNPESKGLFTDKFRSSLASHCNAYPETKSAMALVEEQKSYILELVAKPNVDANNNCSAFLSHVQKDSGDLCRSLYLSLKMRKVQVWYDKIADRLDSRGMVDGIFGSDEFVCIMVRDYFKRRYCIFEWLVAVAFGKPITVILEDDKRFGGVQIEELPEVVPKLFYEHIIQHEIINVNRIYFDSFVAKLEKRIIRHQFK